MSAEGLGRNAQDTEVFYSRSPLREASRRDNAMDSVGASAKGKAARKRAATDMPSEITRLETEHGVTPVQAKNLLARFGQDRASLDAAARRLKVPSH